MKSIREERIQRQLTGAKRFLEAVAREAEALPDQTLAEDLHWLLVKLGRVERAAQHRRYVRQLEEDGQLRLYVSDTP